MTSQPISIQRVNGAGLRAQTDDFGVYKLTIIKSLNLTITIKKA